MAYLQKTDNEGICCKLNIFFKCKLLEAILIFALKIKFCLMPSLTLITFNYSVILIFRRIIFQLHSTKY